MTSRGVYTGEIKVRRSVDDFGKLSWIAAKNNKQIEAAQTVKHTEGISECVIPRDVVSTDKHTVDYRSICGGLWMSVASK